MAEPSEGSSVRYTREHTWARPQRDGTLLVGITEFAQEQLGEIVYGELPPTGRHLDEGESFGTIESIKTASDLYSPVAGIVTTVNAALAAEPTLVNDSPYERAWLLTLRPDDPSVPDRLLTLDEYRATTAA